MKYKFSALLVVLGMTFSFGQEDNEVQNLGDNFSLEGALAMFKKANSLEEFEKLLNEENNNVNNLDLNNDNDIDYISVEDIKDGDNHVIVLSTFLGDKEKQDIATIGIEKTGNDSAVLQIEGDNDLYAENTIIEPVDEKETISGTKGPSFPEIISKPIIVNVWFWPSVRFIYAPNYVVWVSPYHWGFYPRWWKPWRPFRHTIFVSRCVVHKSYFRPAATRRVTVARRVYAPRRHSSTLVVHNRRGTTVVHKNRRGNVKAVKVKRTSVKSRR